jgi:cytochrome c-type biogenesis protein CcmE
LPTKNKKVAIIVSILLIAGSLGYLAFGNFGENIVYFVTPSEVKAFTPETYTKKVRVGGMVVKGSLKTQPEPVGLTFELTDGAATFKEGQGAVVEGQWQDGQTFRSTMIMAKHSEDYMPMELKRAGVELPKKDFMKTLSP